MSIGSREILRERESNGDLEPERDLDGLRDIYRDPALDGVWLLRFRPRLGLLLRLMLLLLLPPVLLLLLRSLT
jgi:hypothetical protein